MSFWKKEKGENNIPIRTQEVLPAYMTGASLADDTGVISLRKAAGISLQKFPRLKRQFAVYKATDISYSMDGYIRNGALDYLTEAISTVSSEGDWDYDGKVPAFPYGKNVASTPYVIELGKHAGVGQEIRKHGEKQKVNRTGTKFVPPVEAIMSHYRDSDDWGKVPALAFVQTDGINSDMGALVKSLRMASQIPIHWVFIYFGMVDMSGQGNDNAENLRKLDDGSIMPGRMVDNVSVFIAGPEPLRVTDTELMNGLLIGPNQWLNHAENAGIIPR